MRWIDPLVLPNQVRRPLTPKHAFEDALDEARLTADDDLDEYLAEALSNPPSQPAVGSLGDITVATGYVAPASLARAYEAEQPEEEVRSGVPPREQARILIAALADGRATTVDLRRLRRRFAAENHPDRVPPEMREEAVAAMAEVNAAIDLALKRSAQLRGAGEPT